jgi:thioesterase domain-containing protein
MSGYGWPYLPLRELVKDRSIVLLNKLPLLRRIPEYAGVLAESLRKAQPRSDGYVLGGWSYGGLLAFAVAQELHSLGEIVHGILMLDSSPPKALHSRIMTDEQIIENRDALLPSQRLNRALKEVSTLDDVRRVARLVVPEDALPTDFDGMSLERAAAWFMGRVSAAEGRRMLASDRPADAVALLRDIRDSHEMWLSYDPKSRSPIPVFQINVAGNAAPREWQQYVEPKVQTVEVDIHAERPGHWAKHIAMLDPENLETLGPKILDALSAIDERRR